MKRKYMSRFDRYKDRFQQQEQVNRYENKEYSGTSYSTMIWKIQQPILRTILSNFRQIADRKIRLLDFACGTGRITSLVEDIADVTEGLDISSAMVDVARKRSIMAEFKVGDILADPELLQPPYDVITSFRFLLNAQPEIRLRVLKRLREVIREPDGLLIVNIHGNSRSIRHPVIIWRRWWNSWHNFGDVSEVMLNEMSPEEAKRLLIDAGFEVMDQIGFGLMPGVLYRTFLRNITFAVDRFSVGKNWSRNWSIDLLFICRPKVQ